MERRQISVKRTPLNSRVVKRRSKCKSYRLSYRSCIDAASRLGLTPALMTQRLSTSRKAPESHDIKEKVNPEHLAVLMKTEWQLSYVTPLYQFSHTQLMSYSRELAAFIVAEKQQGLAVEVDVSCNNYRVSFSVVQGMAETDDDAETILIQIHSRLPFARHDEPQKSVWKGCLTCINGNPEYIRSLLKDFTCLPLFGSSGPEGLTSLVKSWFQLTFDCCFGPLEINDTSMQWLVALWTNCHMESNIQHLKMIWTLPVVPPLQVNYTVNPQDAWKMWSIMRKAHQEDSEAAKDESMVDFEEVMKFTQKVKDHFYRHFRLDLSAGTLSQVSTGLGTAKCNGRIKISNSEYMITTLTLLTECALLKMPM